MRRVRPPRSRPKRLPVVGCACSRHWKRLFKAPDAPAQAASYYSSVKVRRARRACLVDHLALPPQEALERRVEELLLGHGRRPVPGLPSSRVVVASMSHVDGSAPSSPVSGASWTSPTPDSPGASSRASVASEERAQRIAAQGASRWEVDSDVDACRRCARRFTLFFRKHHCRRCGQIVCDACSSHRALLREQELVIDPMLPEMLESELQHPTRVCDACVEAYSLDAPPPAPGLARLYQILRFEAPHTVREAGEPMSRSSSTLNECPVCDRPLSTFPTSEAREQHLAQCLEHAVRPGAAHRTHYLASQLAADSPLIGKECIICMEEFAPHDRIARLTCFCCYHYSWYVLSLTPVFRHGSLEPRPVLSTIPSPCRACTIVLRPRIHGLLQALHLGARLREQLRLLREHRLDPR